MILSHCPSVYAFFSLEEMLYTSCYEMRSYDYKRKGLYKKETHYTIRMLNHTSRSTPHIMWCIYTHVMTNGKLKTINGEEKNFPSRRIGPCQYLGFGMHNERQIDYSHKIAGVNKARMSVRLLHLKSRQRFLRVATAAGEGRLMQRVGSGNARTSGKNVTIAAIDIRTRSRPACLFFFVTAPVPEQAASVCA